MTKATGARPSGDIVNDVVILCRAHASRHTVEVQCMPNLPSDDVIGAGCVATDADCTHQLAVLVVKSEPAPEHIHATDPAAYHRVVWLAIVFSRAAIRDR